MPLQSGDRFLINDGSNSYKISIDNMVDGTHENHWLLINQGSTSKKMKVSTFRTKSFGSNDWMLVNRGSTSYKIKASTAQSNINGWTVVQPNVSSKVRSLNHVAYGNGKYVFTCFPSDINGTNSSTNANIVYVSASNINNSNSYSTALVKGTVYSHSGYYSVWYGGTIAHGDGKFVAVEHRAAGPTFNPSIIYASDTNLSSWSFGPSASSSPDTGGVDMTFQSSTFAYVLPNGDQGTGDADLYWQKSNNLSSTWNGVQLGTYSPAALAGGNGKFLYWAAANDTADAGLQLCSNASNPVSSNWSTIDGPIIPYLTGYDQSTNQTRYGRMQIDKIAYGDGKWVCFSSYVKGPILTEYRDDGSGNWGYYDIDYPSVIAWTTTSNLTGNGSGGATPSTTNWSYYRLPSPYDLNPNQSILPHTLTYGNGKFVLTIGNYVYGGTTKIISFVADSTNMTWQLSEEIVPYISSSSPLSDTVYGDKFVSAYAGINQFSTADPRLAWSNTGKG